MAEIDLIPKKRNGFDEIIYVSDLNENKIDTVLPYQQYFLHFCYGYAKYGPVVSFDVSFFLNGNMIGTVTSTPDHDGNWTWWRYWETSFQPGTYEITIVVDPENKIAETDETNNSYSVNITVGGSSADYLMDTTWSQDGYFMGDSTLELNAYCPVEPGAEAHCVTGCSNTAAAQIFYYFAQNGKMFTLQLNEDDSNTVDSSITIDASDANAARYSYLPFDEVNEKLVEFDVNSAEDVAALIFASGVIAGSNYGEDVTSTGTSGIKDVFERAGFHGLEIDGPGSDLIDRNSVLTDAGWAMIRENIAAGKPVYTSIPNPAHAVVIDGYDAETDSVHINFGWGWWGNKEYSEEYDCYNGSGWYTRAECAEMKINGLLYNITPDTVAPEITINVSAPVDGSVTVSADFSDDVGVYETWYKIGGTSEWQEYTGAFSVTSNGVIYFKAVDKGKNSLVKNVTVDSLYELLDGHVVGSGETLNLSKKKNAVNTIINAGGRLNTNGGTATNTTVNLGGNLYVQSNGTAVEIRENGGFVFVESGADVTFAKNTIRGLEITETCTIHANTSAVGLKVDSEGTVQIYDGGVAEDTSLYYGFVDVYDGGVANYTNVYGSSFTTTLYVNGKTYYSGLVIYNGGSANYTTVGSIGCMIVDSGGSASTTTVDGTMHIYSGGNAGGVTVNAGGNLYIKAGGTATGIRENGGFVEILDENADVTFAANTFSGLTISQKCSVHAGTVADDITVIQGGELYVYSGGTARDTVVEQGILYIYDGATHYGKLQSTSGGEVYVYSGGVIDIDLTSRSVNDDYIITRTSGEPTYSITVSQDQSFGEYKLIERGGAASVNKFIIGNGSATYGTITVNDANRGNINKICCNGVNYIVVWSGRSWHLKVAEYAPPDKPVAVLSTEDFTVNPVTVTADFAEDSVKNEFSYDGSYWQNYEGGLTFYENDEVYFRSINADGDASEVTVCKIANIDTGKPTVSGSVSGVLQDKVISYDWSGVFNDSGSGIEKYIVQWCVAYPDPYTLLQEVTVTDSFWSTETFSDGKYSFRVRAVDRAGNISDWASANSILLETAPPQVPQNPVVTKNGGTVTLNWDAASDLDVTGYKVQIASDADFSNIVGEENVYMKKTSAKFELADGIYYFRVQAFDLTGKNSDWSESASIMVDIVAPMLEVSGGSAEWSNGTVTLTAASYDINGSDIYFKRAGEDEFKLYSTPVIVENNGDYIFYAVDASGNRSAEQTVEVKNLDHDAPETPSGLQAELSGKDLVISWQKCADTLSGIAGYRVRYGKSAGLNGDGEFAAADNFQISGLEWGDCCFYQIKAVDKAGNESDWSAVGTFSIVPPKVQNLSADVNGLTWDAVAGVSGYVVEISNNNFVTVSSFTTAKNGIDTYELPQGNFQWRVRAVEGEDFTTGAWIYSAGNPAAQKLESDGDGNSDVFFGNASGKWTAYYKAEYQGIDGIEAEVSIAGKNKITDVFYGSETDNATLILTDDSCGDALFIDDIYNAFGDKARISQINEIRAGAGDDIIDLSSSQFDADTPAKIYAGDGNDTIWGSAQSNLIFGDAGDDNIIGGVGSDLIIGGAGDDTMHGGGDVDIFCFGGNWGKDTVTQLDGGGVFLWFESGSSDCWDEETLTYTDGENSVTVRGTGNVMVIFGDAMGEEQFAVYKQNGCFSEAVSGKIFDDKNKGILA